MINKRHVAIVLAVGLLLSISCVVGQMEVFTGPLLEAQPIQSGPGPSNSENFTLAPALLDTRPIQSGSGSPNAGWTGGAPSLGNLIDSATLPTQGQTGIGQGGSSVAGNDGAFLFLMGVPGESSENSHEGWIDILSFNYSIKAPHFQAQAQGEASAERSDLGDLVVIKSLDRSSPQIYLLASNGRMIPEARLEILSNGIMVMQYLLKDVRIRSVQVLGRGANNGQKPLEGVALSYSKIQWSYTPQDESGTPDAEIKTGWDLDRGMSV
jgi:type VI secretion system secreted protein Hcp